jgi:hypothetical protein
MYKMDSKLDEYFNRLQKMLGETDSADKILEGPWWDVVVKELNHLSYYCARYLQLETKKPYRKDFTDGSLADELPYEEAPPTRLLALNLIITYWLGWLDAKGGHALDTEPVAAWRRIKEAYDRGKQAANGKNEKTS